MKAIIYSLLLSMTLLAQAQVHAQGDPGDTTPPEAGHGITVTVMPGDQDDGMDAIAEEATKDKIKDKVLSIMTTSIAAAGDDMTEPQKAEMKRELKEAFQDLGELVENADGHDADNSISFDTGDMGVLEALIALTAIILIFGTPLIIVAAVLISGYRKRRLMHETINQYVSIGKDIPPEVLQGLHSEVAPKTNLHRGLVMSGAGIGIFACFTLIGAVEAAAFGLIPLFIGLAQLLIWKLESR